MAKEDWKSIGVLGAGESGVGAALLARRYGYEVFVSDRGPIAEGHRRVLDDAGIEYEAGQHRIERLSVADLIIKSPGIPDQVPLMQKLIAARKPVVSEIEFAWQFIERATIVGITGSNGKTTTTRLTHHLALAGGLDATLAGNVGIAFARSLLDRETAYYILELSSFQLDGIKEFRPDYAAILNMSPDHLDRYDYRMEKYVAAKFRITRNQGPDDYFFYLQEDPYVAPYLDAHPTRAQVYGLSTDSAGPDGVTYEGEWYDLERTTLIGDHNARNALFAIAMVRRLGVSPDQIRAGLQTFRNDPHRMEVVAEVNGVTYYNDSKATNVDAAFFALKAMRRPVVWIAGGQDKGNDYQPLLELVAERVSGLICLGVENEKLKATFGPLVDKVAESRSAAGAVAQAYEWAEPGDVVLLSPACASFDLFKNYIDRGDQFKMAVRELQQQNAP